MVLVMGGWIWNRRDHPGAGMRVASRGRMDHRSPGNRRRLCVRERSFPEAYLRRLGCGCAGGLSEESELSHRARRGEVDASMVSSGRPEHPGGPQGRRGMGDSAAKRLDTHAAYGL